VIVATASAPSDTLREIGRLDGWPMRDPASVLFGRLPCVAGAESTPVADTLSSVETTRSALGRVGFSTSVVSYRRVGTLALQSFATAPGATGYGFARGNTMVRWELRVKVGVQHDGIGMTGPLGPHELRNAVLAGNLSL
jgi:hypothetical protein